MFFNGWDGIVRTAIAGLMAYVSLIVILRISGKRTLAKLNAFDLVVTVALGSTLATILLSKDTALAEGVFALAMLVAFQFVVSWLSVRSARIRQLVRSEPTLLFYHGEFLQDSLRGQRVTESEIRQAARSQGILDLENHAAVLESDGTVSILPTTEQTDRSTLVKILGVEARAADSSTDCGTQREGLDR